MSEITRGEVSITLAGVERTLKPSLAAYATLGQQSQGYWDIQRRLLESHIPTCALVVRLGLGMKEADQQRVMRLLFESSLHEIRVPLAEYVHRLFHNGRSAQEVEAEQAEAEGGEPEGNGDAGALDG